tara:strand:+ start:734 stop:988 length:255 start_codon:yes stop_codon:yes gene_type:complete
VRAAFSAIVFRLTSYGLTPNRVVVLGSNLVIMAHLAWTCRACVGLLRGKCEVEAVKRTVSGYLPIYVAWAAFLTFGLPFLFGFS